MLNVARLVSSGCVNLDARRLKIMRPLGSGPPAQQWRAGRVGVPAKGGKFLFVHWGIQLCQPRAFRGAARLTVKSHFGDGVPIIEDTIDAPRAPHLGATMHRLG